MVNLCVYIYNAFLFANVAKHKLNDETFKFCYIYFDFLQIFYGPLYLQTIDF